MRPLIMTGVCLSMLMQAGCHSCFKRSCRSDAGRMAPMASDIPPLPPSGRTIPPAGIDARSNYSPPAEMVLPERRSVPPQPQPQPLAPSSAKIAPDSTANKLNSSRLPLGITEFSVIKDGVWSGYRPELDGLDWLKSQGLKQALLIRTASEDSSSDQTQWEKRGITLQTITLEPGRVEPQAFQDFLKIINNNRPVFVYDRTGSTQGILWYIYFRKVEMQSPEVAKLRAERLGLKADGSQKQLIESAQAIIDAP
jgi:protein tyrosine phosphatase (PTP) superfamily phosphohydrolase (DUF442 family)